MRPQERGFGARAFRRVWLICLAVLLRAAEAAQCYTSFNKTAYPSCQLLSPSYALHWGISGTTISYAVEVDGPVGWLALGISDGGGKRGGADIVVVLTPDGGHTWAAHDYFTEGEVQPSLDTVLGGTEDVELGSVVRTAAHTAAAFSRPLESCDPWDWPIVEDVNHTAVWAYGTGSYDHHGAAERGSASLLLQPLPGAPPALPHPPDLEAFVMQLPRPFAVPTSDTTYMCVNIAFPSDAKYHAIRYDSLVQSSLVHHQTLYSCTSPPARPVGDMFECLHHGEPTCAAVYMISGRGSPSTVVMPPEAALPFGASSVQYAMLRIHYTNPAGLAGQVDQSGFVAYLTRQLRGYDMGTLTLGSTNITLPPGQADVAVTPNVCPGACTQHRMPFHAFSSFFLMHRLGKSISTRLVRDGRELPAVGYTNHYNYEAPASVGAPIASRTILPGDTLITTCFYDTRNATGVTTHGPGSSDELCYNFLMYWPSLVYVDTCITQASVGGVTVPVASCALASDLLDPNKTPAALLADGQMVESPVGGPAYEPYLSACGLSATRTPVVVQASPAAAPPTATAAARGRLEHAGREPAKGAVFAILLVVLACALLGCVAWLRFGRPRPQRDILSEVEQAYMLPNRQG